MMDVLVLCSLTFFMNVRERDSKGFLLLGPVDKGNKSKVTFSENIQRQKSNLEKKKCHGPLEPFSHPIFFFVELSRNNEWFIIKMSRGYAVIMP